MIRRMCAEPGCGRCAEEGGTLCPAHKGKPKAPRLFEGTRRKASAAWHPLYSTARWRALRRAVLEARPFCAACGAPATEVDHIVPHRGSEDLFYSEANLQPLCKRCHSAKTLAENGRFARARAP